MSFDLQHNRRLFYWLCQISGWCAYIAINQVITVTASRFTWRMFFIDLYLGVLGLGLTHVYRYIIATRKWIELSYKEIIFRILFSSFFLAALIIGLLFSIMFFNNMIPVNVNITGSVTVNLFYAFFVIIIWSLLYFGFHYLENYRTSEIEKLVWEAAVKDFELKTLKSQLNPHFMFNAMNSIRALIEEDPERAKTAITQLSNIFRYSLRIERVETVPLEDEIKVIEDYLALELVRYEERLKYSITIAPDTRSIEIPPMMLQTLVENGIKHGVAKMPAGGEITLTAFAKDNALTIIITNHGVLNEDDVKNAKGFGLANTKQRLHLLYGSRAQFNLSNENDKVVVKIIIPTGEAIC
ncbi:MAG: histidine kinase [Ignavibacteriales bacterium]|nr:histidine kinase [Ignavibacteriales bacterium]